MRTSRFLLLLGAILTALHARSDWPAYGHDPGGMRYSTLKQINAKNVATLEEAWTFDPTAAVTETRGRGRGRGGARPRRSQATPLVVGDVMYLGTAFNRVVALEPETGRKIWEYESRHPPAQRGIAYWPGNKQLPPQIIFGSADGWLVSLNAKTGKLSPGFGNEGMVNMKPGVADKFPNSYYGMSSP